MSADAINFKVFLIDEDNENIKEIRRFDVDIDVSTNFNYMCQKLQAIFPILKEKRFSLYWRDEEDDKISIGSDEELQVAVRETHFLKKLYITLNSTIENRVEVQSNKSKTSHTDVVCDNCEKDIKGFRYKCIQCPDYDLCGECEAKGLHPQHCTIRLNMPLQWKSHYRRLSEHFKKFYRDHISRSNENSE